MFIRRFLIVSLVTLFAATFISAGCKFGNESESESDETPSESSSVTDGGSSDDTGGVVDTGSDLPEAEAIDEAIAEIDEETEALIKSLDSDSDGKLDTEDNCPIIFNPKQEDVDVDWIGNHCDDDMDNDGIANAEDNCPFVANAEQINHDEDPAGDACDEDDDNDGKVDAEDNCPFIANFLQVNTDGDTEGDACDADDDDDSILDEPDNCPLVANAEQIDEDANGKGDACEEDADDDGIIDALDNCPEVANDDQKNTDEELAEEGVETVADEKGDMCDEDMDGDEVLNGVDNCPLIANKDQADFEHDGMGDPCDDDDDNDLILDSSDACPHHPKLPLMLADNDPERCDTKIDGRVDTLLKSPITTLWLLNHQQDKPEGQMSIYAPHSIAVANNNGEKTYYIGTYRHLLRLKIEDGEHKRVLESHNAVVAPRYILAMDYLPEQNTLVILSHDSDHSSYSKETDLKLITVSLSPTDLGESSENVKFETLGDDDIRIETIPLDNPRIRNTTQYNMGHFVAPSGDVIFYISQRGAGKDVDGNYIDNKMILVEFQPDMTYRKQAYVDLKTDQIDIMDPGSTLVVENNLYIRDMDSSDGGKHYRLVKVPLNDLGDLDLKNPEKPVVVLDTPISPDGLTFDPGRNKIILSNIRQIFELDPKLGDTKALVGDYTKYGYKDCEGGCAVDDAAFYGLKGLGMDGDILALDYNGYNLRAIEYNGENVSRVYPVAGIAFGSMAAAELLKPFEKTMYMMDIVATPDGRMGYFTSHNGGLYKVIFKGGIIDQVELLDATTSPHKMALFEPTKPDFPVDNEYWLYTAQYGQKKNRVYRFRMDKETGNMIGPKELAWNGTAFEAQMPGQYYFPLIAIEPKGRMLFYIGDNRVTASPNFDTKKLVTITLNSVGKEDGEGVVVRNVEFGLERPTAITTYSEKNDQGEEQLYLVVADAVKHQVNGKDHTNPKVFRIPINENEAGKIEFGQSELFLGAAVAALGDKISPDYGLGTPAGQLKFDNTRIVDIAERDGVFYLLDKTGLIQVKDGLATQKVRRQSSNYYDGKINEVGGFTSGDHWTSGLDLLPLPDGTFGLLVSLPHDNAIRLIQ